MTILWSPDKCELRPKPRLAVFSARGGLRDEHWRKVRRRLDPEETTPLPAPDESVIEELSRWYRDSRWAPYALGVGAVGSIALLACAIAFGWTWDGAVEWIARGR